MVVDIPDTSKLVEISSDDEQEKELEEDPEEDQEADLELGELQADYGVEDVESGVSHHSYDSGKEFKDEFDSDYDPSRDC